MTRQHVAAFLATFILASVSCVIAAPGEEMDYGPFLTGSLDRDKAVSQKASNGSTEQDGPNANTLATKAVCVKLVATGNAQSNVVGGVAFDTDLLRFAVGWGDTHGFLDLKNTHLTTPKGSVPLAPAGHAICWVTRVGPGWSTEPEFKDPRPAPYGPLPKSVGRYNGLYINGQRVVFSYTVGDCHVLETPGFIANEWVQDSLGLHHTRTFRLGPTGQTLYCLLRTRRREEGGSAADLFGQRRGVSVETREGRTFLKVEPSERERVFAVSIDASTQQASDVPIEDPLPLTRGGPARYPPVQTHGSLGTSSGAYVVDTLTLPDDNPWKSWIRPSGLDFFSDGRLAVCTLNGDVWVVSGVDEKLEKLSWRRFATGLYEPLGLRVVNDEVYVLGRDQITRLHDLNGDGEADFYENFNNDAPCSANYHGFAFDLDTDSKGNFYYTRAGQRMSPKLPMHGALLRVSKDGSKVEPIAAGLRAANGLCVGPDDFITVADNQGNWVPSSRINVIKPGGFYGWMPHVLAAGGSPRTDYDPPLCWIPITVDNSSGSQVWATDQRFGPLSGRMFHTSYGHACLMLGLIQKLDDGAYNGGVIKMPFRFDSGVMRGRVNPKDGQLYLCGLRGWQTDGTRDGTLVRVRSTGKPLYMPTDFRVVPGGIELTFSQPLDPGSAQDVGSYGIEQWNYKWGEQYGSPDYSVKDPAKQGHDEVTVASAKLLGDRKTVMLSIPDLRPVMQMQINVDVDAADGTNIHDAMWLTINRVPGNGK
jgi:glucose/arabinose dehydrogenase